MNDPITAQEAARRLNVSRSTISRLARAGELVTDRKTTAPNSHYIVSAASVEAYRQKRQTR
jgi:excisionase family DNA binding protein